MKQFRTTHRISAWILLLGILVILCAFGLALWTLMQDGMWIDETWSLWVVRPEHIGEMLARIAADYHPPLYFLLLDGWVRIAGDTPLSARYLSLLAATMAAAAVFALGRRLFDWQTGLIAVVLFGASGFFRYYAGETRMYGLLMLVSALCMMAFLAWLRRPSVLRTVIYGALIAALVYTHYHGGWLVAAQAAYVLIVRRDRLVRWMIPIAIGAALFAPWVPVLIAQFGRRPDKLVSNALPSDFATVQWIVYVISGGLGLLLFLPYLMGPNLGAIRQRGRSLIQVALWLIGAPAALLAVNATGARFFYHPRYLIGILPAGVLLVAFGLRAARWRGLALAALGAIVVVWVAQYRDFWPSRSAAYDQVLETISEGLNPGDALIVDIDRTNLLDYYDRVKSLHIRDRATLDITGKHSTFQEVLDLPAVWEEKPVVWVALPRNESQSWAVLQQITHGRHAAYGGSIENMLIYRFEDGEDADLRYAFGESLEVRGSIPGGHVWLAAHEPFCTTIMVEAGDGLDGMFSMGVHLVRQDGHSAAQWDGGLEVRSAGEMFSVSPCLAGENPLAAGEYEVQVTVYNWRTGERLALTEISTGSSVDWGDTLVIGLVEVTP